jgi:PAS domain S-box-containing protein
VNARFTRLTGFSPEEVRGRTPGILKSGRQSGEFYADLWNTILQGREWRGQLCNRKKNGMLYWESVCIAPLLDGKGEITHFVAVKEDITRERQKDLALQRAKEEAETANRAKSEFLSGMSHELRTPLTAIIGFSDVLLENSYGPLNEKQKEYVTDILESGRHLLSLINDILDLSKVEAGKMEPDLTPLPVRPLLERSLVMIKEKAMKHGIRLGLDIAEPVNDLEIQADERMMKQVMVNLVSNAVKFTPDRGVITVQADRTDGELVVSVTDTGIGIPPELREKIFEAFYQADGKHRDARGQHPGGEPRGRKGKPVLRDASAPARRRDRPQGAAARRGSGSLRQDPGDPGQGLRGPGKGP